MQYHVIASGSKGNCTVIFDNDSLILIDIGISKKRLEEGLKEINKNLNDIDAILITHSHSDHIQYKKAYDNIPFYSFKNDFKANIFKKIKYFNYLLIKSFYIIPIKAVHDSSYCMGFVINNSFESLTYITDTGCFLKEDLPFCKNPTYLIIESNHDLSMLEKTNRTRICKERIKSDLGHLCNEDSALACLDIIGDNTKEIVLAHISEEANTPELALKAYKKIFASFKKKISQYNVRVANEYKSLSGGNDGN